MIGAWSKGSLGVQVVAPGAGGRAMLGNVTPGDVLGAVIGFGSTLVSGAIIAIWRVGNFTGELRGWREDIERRLEDLEAFMGVHRRRR